MRTVEDSARPRRRGEAGRPFLGVLNASALGDAAPGDWYEFGAGATASELPILLRLGQQPTGRVVCTGLVIGDGTGGEVNAATLRAVRLPELISDVLDGDHPGLPGAQRDFTDIPELRPRPGRAGYDAEHYRKVANAYRHALSVAPDRPTAWLCEHLTPQPTSPTLRRWLAEARRRGHLGEAVPGRPGERPTTEES